MTDASKSNSNWRWPLFLVGLLTLSVVSSVVLMGFAVNDPAFAVEDDYYQKALHWDDVMAQERVNGELGWSVDLDATPSEGVTALRLMLRGADGLPLRGAQVGVTARHNARASRTLDTSLTANPDGSFSGVLPLARRGLWQFDVVATRGEDTFVASLRKDVAVPRGGAR
jgi:hypothetical protein